MIPATQATSIAEGKRHAEQAAWEAKVAAAREQAKLEVPEHMDRIEQVVKCEAQKGQRFAYLVIERTKEADKVNYVRARALVFYLKEKLVELGYKVEPIDYTADGIITHKLHISWG